MQCASHNLNLVINDSVEATVGGVTFFGSVSEIFNFFGRSLNRWAELALTEENVKKLKLKRLCTTRWSSRIDAVTAVKNRYIDILKVLTRICLESKDSKERSDATGLKHNMEKFEFILFIIIWERLLLTINSASRALQSVEIDLSAATRLLSMAFDELAFMRDSWETIITTAKTISAIWKIAPQFHVVRKRRTKKFFDELNSDECLQDLELAFKNHVFFSIVDTAMAQLMSRFEGQRLVSAEFSFFIPNLCCTYPILIWN